MPSGQPSKPRFSRPLLIALAVLIIGTVLHFGPISSKQLLDFSGPCNMDSDEKTVAYRLVLGQKPEFNQLQPEVYYDDICAQTVNHKLYIY